jgi:hypothetical protein
LRNSRKPDLLLSMAAGTVIDKSCGAVVLDVSVP